METYANYGGGSGVAAYNIGVDSITVYFKEGSAYVYSFRVTGVSDVNYMKKLAEAGQGLNTFINTNVRKRYERKLR